MRYSKGITPVIAIVLLITITIGAVGMLYTQFSAITDNNDARENFEEKNKLRTAEMEITAVTNSTEGNLTIFVKNVGSEPVNSSLLDLRLGYEGSKPITASVFASEYPSLSKSATGCFTSSNIIRPGDTHRCETGFILPPLYKRMDLVISLDRVDKQWRYVCERNSKSQEGC